MISRQTLKLNATTEGVYAGEDSHWWWGHLPAGRFKALYVSPQMKRSGLLENDLTAHRLWLGEDVGAFVEYR